MISKDIYALNALEYFQTGLLFLVPSMNIHIQDWNTDHLELRVNKTTPYAILTLGELEVFEYNPK
ncbi:hypothetical protein [Leptospira kanakyensis]|uniref:Uncharacterized protein n=1 Tax=Leptospira kanakyensis TaxID=2484968 RepID=A0A6N4QI26_9LEPT|nr:hypothetical protein [Leptospira kanakyensis]TGK53412.1 hypothetical protein EHQ11_03420 [Leptospira kanakyensis]TGK72918.1 hypothetical protein EHQ18_03495 [Leptospira kanakyensis]